MSELTICICTRRRADDLRETLRSVERSHHAVSEVVVSADADDEHTREVVAASPLPVRYVAGPQQGLSANRNRALAEVRTRLVAYLDDDCHLSEDFADAALETMEREEAQIGSGRVIVTGRETKHGQLVRAHEQSFRFQHVPYAPGQAMRSIVSNSTVMPTALVARVRFDERLRYGYEEVDFASRATAQGAVIVECPEAVNNHFPSPASREDYVTSAEVARLYATFKRYAMTDGDRRRAFAFAVLAPPHAIASAAKTQRLRGALHAVTVVARATEQVRELRRERSRNAHNLAALAQ